MKSLTKPPVPPDAIASIFHKHLGQNVVSATELTDGWYNAIFDVTTSSGVSFILKVAPPATVPVLRYEKDIIEAEVQALNLWSSDPRITVPKVIVFDKSFKEIPSPYFIMQKLDGVQFEKIKDTVTAEQKEFVDIQIGQILAMFDDVKGTGFGPFLTSGFKTWRDAYVEMLDWLRLDAIDGNVELPAGTFESAIPKLYSLEEVTEPVFVHWDLWYANVFVDPTSLKITGVLDFERALWGDRLMEANFGNEDSIKNTITGYGRNLFELPGAKDRRFLYNLYVCVIMVIESKYRGFDSDHEKWARGLLSNLLATSS